jgi:hypothetical protein
MRFAGRVLVVILSAGTLVSAHAVERDRGTVTLPAWNIAAPDFAHDSGMPESGFRLAGATTVQYRASEGGVGLKRAPTRAEGIAAPRSGDNLSASAAPAASESTDWMLLLSGIVVAGYIARRRTRDVAD